MEQECKVRGNWGKSGCAMSLGINPALTIIPQPSSHTSGTENEQAFSKSSHIN